VAVNVLLFPAQAVVGAILTLAVTGTVMITATGPAEAVQPNLSVTVTV
jgi:hypothetical protein